MPPVTNTTTNRYGSIAAEIYDIDKPYGALPDTAYHLERLAAVAGPILEPACGSGRTLIPLLEAGLDVAGFDPSPEMLDRCKARCAEKGLATDLRAARFEDFSYPRPFAAIVIPAGSFTLIDDFAVAMDVLRRFHAHLAPGGLLVLDIDPLSSLSASGEDRRSWTAGNGDLLTIDGRRVATDWLSQTAKYHLRYERWRAGALIDSQLEPMVQRFWGREEFALALAAAGYSDVRVTGGYDRTRAPRRNDRVLTFEATRG